VKLPRDLSGREVVKGLKRLGFSVENQEGSHIRLSRGGGLRVTVPNHPALLPKTLKSIMKQANVTIDDLMAVI
jgi:predicted RNA binding protein YcfA (HicA-like mRNA interferase family)